MNDFINNIKSFIAKAKKTERTKDLAIHTNKIYYAFYNTSIDMSDLEIAESLNNVLERIKYDIQEREQNHMNKRIISENALSKL